MSSVNELLGGKGVIDYAARFAIYDVASRRSAADQDDFEVSRGRVSWVEMIAIVNLSCTLGSIT